MANKNIDQYKYRCKVCGALCTKKVIPGVNVPVTRTGDYGDNATPTPATLTVEAYNDTCVAFVDDPTKITTTRNNFFRLFRPGASINVSTTSGTNDGNYTIASRGVTESEILLSDDDSLTTENAATAGNVVISLRIYQPNITTGCHFCGSLNSK